MTPQPDTRTRYLRSFRVSAEMDDAIDEVAREAGIPASEWLRRLVAAALEVAENRD